MVEYVQIVRKAAGSKQVVLFPFGGGSGFSYMPLVNCFPSHLEVIVINPPGHLMMDGEPLVTIPEMVRLYKPRLKALLKENALFFGHSIGGLVAYEVARALSPEFQVRRMIVSSVNPPHCAADSVDLRSDMDGEELVQLSSKLGGLPEIFKSEPDILEGFMRGLRGDLKALENYIAHPVPEPEKVDIQAAVLYSLGDTIVNLERLKGWGKYLQCKEFIPFEGNHFYLLQEENLKIVANIVARYTE
jgi:external thioesterase TEII